MKTTLRLLSLLFLFICSIFFVTEPLLAGKKKSPMIAVYPTIIAKGTKDPAKYRLNVQEITNRLVEGLRGSRRFRIYERDDSVLAKSVRKEQEFAMSEYAQGNAADFGKLKNVNLLVQPILVDFKLSSSFKMDETVPDLYYRKDYGQISVTFKVLNTTTGEVKIQVTDVAKYRGREITVEGRRGGPGKKAFLNLVNKVTQKGTSSIVNALYPIKVIKSRAGQIFLNRGRGGGIAVGDKFQIFSAGEAMIDPDSGENYGAEEVPIGMVKIKRVTPKFSVAVAIGDLDDDPKSGDVVRKPQ